MNTALPTRKRLRRQQFFTPHNLIVRDRTSRSKGCCLHSSKFSATFPTNQLPAVLYCTCPPHPLNCSLAVGTCPPHPLQLFIICGYMPSPSPCNCSASVGTCSPHHLKLFIICWYVPSPSPQTDHQWLHALPNPQTVHHLWLHALPNPLKLFIVTLPNPSNCSSYVGTCPPQPLKLFIICGYMPSPTPPTVHHLWLHTLPNPSNCSFGYTPSPTPQTVHFTDHTSAKILGSVSDFKALSSVAIEMGADEAVKCMGPSAFWIKENTP